MNSILRDYERKKGETEAVGTGANLKNTYFCVCVWVLCLRVCLTPNVQSTHRIQKRALECLKLELQAVVSGFVAAGN